MRIQTLYIICFLAVTLGVQHVDAQSMVTTQPRASQKALIGQTVGITDIYIKYHRPAVKGREIWGKLVPYGQVWRAGANENTIIKFTHDVEIDGQSLKAGKYGLHMLVNADAVDIIFSKDHSAWGSYSYVESEDALRVRSALEPSQAHYELLTYTFDEVGPNSAVCALHWGNKQINFKIGVDVHHHVLANLRDELQLQPGWSWVGWNEAAIYCVQNKVNLQEGMQWATRAVFMNANTNSITTYANAHTALDPDGDANELFIEYADKALKSYQVTWKEWHGMANYLFQNNMDRDRATMWLDKSIAMNPTMTNLMTKYNLLKKAGKTEKAEKIRNDALARGTNSELNTYGYQLLFAGKGQEALEIFRMNAKKNPTDPNVFDSLGECYVNLGMKDKAIEAFKKSFSLNPPPAVRANSEKLLRQIGVDPASLIRT